MARRTFGRAGQIIEVPSGSIDSDVRITEAILDGVPVSIDGDGRVEVIDIIDSGDASDIGGDFEPIGDVIRTEPIADTTGTGYSDPSTVTGKRPRKPRGPNRPKEGAQQNTRVVSLQLEKVLFSLHTMAAATLQEPELCIDEDEAKILADAVEKVANAYNFSAMFSPKTQAGVDLCIALVTVYGHRVMKIARRPRKNIRNVTPIDKAVTQS